MLVFECVLLTRVESSTHTHAHAYACAHTHLPKSMSRSSDEAPCDAFVGLALLGMPSADSKSSSETREEVVSCWGKDEAEPHFSKALAEEVEPYLALGCKRKEDDEPE